jgi:FMN phosphatase YigB (HAD superfamily)
MAQAHDTVILFDVDNTLFDNDGLQRDIGDYLVRNHGQAAHDRYWAIYEEIRGQVDYADYIGALERYRLEALHDPSLLRMSNWLLDYDFAGKVFPGALDAIAHVSRWGTPVILSDGDAVFQPRKIERAGLWRAFDGRVLIYVHKERELDWVERHYPARRYVLVDDKVRILDAVKRAWGKRLTTVFPRQGHYALDAAAVAKYPPADLTIESIGDLVQHDISKIWQEAEKAA